MTLNTVYLPFSQHTKIHNTTNIEVKGSRKGAESTEAIALITKRYVIS